MKKLFTLSLVVVAIGMNAQNFQKIYGGSGDEQGEAVVATLDGGYAIAGYTSSFGAGGEDVFIIKTDNSGNIQWQKTYGESGNDNGWPVTMAQTPDSGFVVGAYTLSFAASDWDFYIIKVDKNGLIQWSSKYASAGGKEEASDIFITANGDIIICGTDNLGGFGSADGFMIKLDMNGNEIWRKNYGGNNNDHFVQVMELASGNLIVGANTKTYGPGATAAYMVKTDATGNLIWDFTYGGNQLDAFISCDLTPNNEIIAVGITDSYGAGQFDFLLVKLDTNGTVIWSKTYGGPGVDYGTAVRAYSDGSGYLMSGYTDGYGNGGIDFMVVRTNATGDILWTKTFGTSATDQAKFNASDALHITSDKGFIITGWSDSLSVGGNDIVFIKSDSIGSILCSNATLSVATPSILTNNPSSGVNTIGSYSFVTTIVGNSSFVDSTICYCVAPAVCVNCTPPYCVFRL